MRDASHAFELALDDDDELVRHAASQALALISGEGAVESGELPVPAAVEPWLQWVRQKLGDLGARIDPPLSLGELGQIERVIGMRLPADYRAFVTTIGNGVGPLATSGLGGISLRGLVGAHTRNEWDESLPVETHITLVHYGCAIESRLVIRETGPGEMWHEPANGDPYAPILTETGDPKTFSSWYEAVLDREHRS